MSLPVITKISVLNLLNQRRFLIEWDLPPVTADAPITERFDVVAGTVQSPYSGSLTAFDLPFTYSLNANNLLVFNQGILERKLVDYVESDNNTITFLSPTTAGDKVSFVKMDVPIIDGFYVYRSTSPYSGFTKIATVARGTQQYINQVPFTFGVTYFFKVTQFKGTDESDIISTGAISDSTFKSFEEQPLPVQALSTDFVYNEPSGGLKNGVNTIFTTSHVYRAGTLNVYVNGAKQTKGTDFIERSDQTSYQLLTIVPITADDIITEYIKVGF